MCGEEGDCIVDYEGDDGVKCWDNLSWYECFIFFDVELMRSLCVVVESVLFIVVVLVFYLFDFDYCVWLGDIG